MAGRVEYVRQLRALLTKIADGRELEAILRGNPVPETVREIRALVAEPFADDRSPAALSDNDDAFRALVAETFDAIHAPVTLSNDDVARIAADIAARVAAEVDDGTSRELIRALTAAIGRAGCPGSSAERDGFVGAIEAIVAELHRVQEQRNELQDGTAYRKLRDEYTSLWSRSRALRAAMLQAANMLQERSVDLARVEEWRKLATEVIE